MKIYRTSIYIKQVLRQQIINKTVSLLTIFKKNWYNKSSFNENGDLKILQILTLLISIAIKIQLIQFLETLNEISIEEIPESLQYSNGSN